MEPSNFPINLAYPTGSDAVPATYWRALRSISHEVINEDGLCDECLQRDMQNLLSCAGPTFYRIKLDSLQEIIRRNHCWICRFFSRICARGLLKSLFVQAWQFDFRLSLSQDPGGWESNLQLTHKQNPATSCDLAIGYTGKPGVISHDVLGAIESFGEDIYITTDTKRSSMTRKIAQLRTFNSYQSSVDFTLIRRWLEVCSTQHGDLCCATVTSLQFPRDFRLIDVESGLIVLAEVSSQYVALSYVRGSCRMSDRASHPLKSLPPLLPNVVRDALQVVRALGKRYLWVDDYCIDQTDHASRQTTINEMDSIYRGAYLTICVLSEKDADGRIPGIGRHFLGRFQVVSETETQRYIATRFRSTYNAVFHSPWSTRAWTFQEGSLSRRRLCFHEEGVFVLCQKELFHDLVQFETSEGRIQNIPAFQNIYHFPLGFEVNIKAWDFEVYARIVASYSDRALTLSSDAYNAIAGTLKHITLSTKVSFVGGLPSQDLLNALLWFRHPYTGYRNRNARRAGFPSWTWLGWQASSGYQYWLRPSSVELPPNNNTMLFSVVNRGTTPYRSLIEVLKSSEISWQASASGTEQAHMILLTEKAIFLVRWLPQTQPLGTRVGGQWLEHWQLLDATGAPIDRPQKDGIYDNYVEFVSYDDLPSFSMRLDATVSEHLLKSGTDTLEFVLLQHWTEKPEHPIPAHERNDAGLHPSDKDLAFTDRIWVMAIKAQSNGCFERIAVIWLPPVIWHAANPQPTVVRLA